MLDGFMTGLMVGAFLLAAFSTAIGFIVGIASWAWALDAFNFTVLVIYAGASLRMRRRR